MNKSENVGAVFLTITVLSLAGAQAMNIKRKRKRLVMFLTIK